MNNVTSIIFGFIILFISNTIFCKDIYTTDFYHIEINTNDATKTKFEEIEKIKIKSFISILDNILTTENINHLIKKNKYQKYLNNFVQNIIIENELITNEKYIADIKINFIKKDIINFLRNNKLDYADIPSENFLILSSYNEELITYGLTEKNIFYDIDKLVFEFKNQLLNIKLPDLNTNDRFIISYKNIISNDNESLLRIANKYKVKDIFIIKINNINNKKLNIWIDYYSSQTDKIMFVGIVNLFDINKLQNYVFAYLSDWWKNNHLIDNSKINSVTCVINSNDYDDLIYIKDKIKNLSQFKSIKTIIISYNNNIEKIEFYGDYSIFAESLLLKNIKISSNEKCLIRSTK